MVNRIILYEEYRLIEREESEINGAWKGVHLILFFMAFVFGLICSFSFHILMYLFDEKCVLFPKLLSLGQLKQSLEGHVLLHEDSLPVDFVSTQWMDTRTCYLPVYVPLVSAIFGLVWTTIFFMCSAGNRAMTGLERPWRILLPVFIFSMAMGGVSVYAAYVTHTGLQDLCEKLSEVTGSKGCTYIVNIVTLAYERRIRGVYQATMLTIVTAWAHTICWLLAAGVALARVLLVIDFRLVRVHAELRGNIEAILERYEQHIKTISPETTSKTAASDNPVEHPVNIHDAAKGVYSEDSVKVRFVNKGFVTDSDTKIDVEYPGLTSPRDMTYSTTPSTSESSSTTIRYQTESQAQRSLKRYLKNKSYKRKLKDMRQKLKLSRVIRKESAVQTDEVSVSPSSPKSLRSDRLKRMNQSASEKTLTPNGKRSDVLKIKDSKEDNKGNKDEAIIQIADDKPDVAEPSPDQQQEPPPKKKEKMD